MSNSDEPKDCSKPLTASQENLEKNKKALKISLSIQWSDDDPLDRRNFLLETTLQTWANTQRNSLTAEVLDVSEDRTAVVLSIKPPPDLSDLEALKGKMLPRKDGKMLKVTSISWEGDEAQTSQDGVGKAPPPPPSEAQHEWAAVNEDGCAGPPENEYVVLPADTFLALSYTQSEELRRIEKRNNCVVKVKVEFAKGEGEGDPQKALSEFKAFICSLGGLPPERPRSKELDTQTRFVKEVFNVGGVPRRNVPEASSWTSQLTAGDVEVDIDDPLFRDGITIEKSCWKLMATSYSEHLLKVQRKFNVRFEVDHGVRPGKVNIRAAGGRNLALECHALRALCQLYKRIVSSNQPFGATGFTGPDPPKNTPKRDHGNPLLNGQSGDSTLTKKAMVEAAAGGGGGGHEEDMCPICLDTFEDKRELDCKHEFCRGCLVQSISNLGPCCPVCKHVFGNMVGNQPDGTMDAIIIPKSLPGFPRCGTIVITYHIPSGTQTEKHPNPGKPYQGSRRKAYLPNNREGQEVLQLLQRAFTQKLVFTVGQSRTTNAENQVTWNDIHHKTSMESGPTGYGYPDPDYLKRVRQELKAKGIE